MGEVFAAEDTRLHRKIAIKVLSKLMAGDPERRLRFEREAQAIAALNHPNIVTIYSVEEADGVPFLTMELVEGRPLGELIPSGGLPLEALLRIGIAVSDAMAAAHQRGITHRDLKPANVMVTADGRPKVLDFGLAKLQETDLAPDGLTRLPSDDLTGEGRIIGTVAYMSPEQAEGRTVDQRSDIFSLGVMLHELGTGERPFKGETNISVISSILKDNPPTITDLNPALPAGLAKIIRRSLAKDPSRRYQTATDLRNELEELKQEVDSGLTVSMPSSRIPAAQGRGGRSGAWKRWVAAGVLALLAGAAAVYYSTARGRTAGGATFEPDRFTRLTTGGNTSLAAISGDGRYVVHIKNDGTQSSLWVRQTATPSDVQIVPPAPVRYDGLTYSPDGDYVYYVIYSLTGGVGTLYKVPVLGGPSQRILEDVDSRVTFSPDGKQFAFTRGAPGIGEAYVMVADASGGNVRTLSTLPSPEQFQVTGPAWSPDGRTILASARSVQDGPHVRLYALDATTGTPRQIGSQRWRGAGDLEWLPDGGSFVLSAVEPTAVGPQIWQIAFPTGDARRVTNDLNNYTGASLSADGRTLVTVQAENIANIWVMPAGNPARIRQLTTGRGRGDGLTGMAWTTDGRLLFGSAASGRPEIWTMNADGSDARQLTNDDGASVSPSASRDGKFIVMQKVKADGMRVWRMGTDGSDARALTTGGAELQPVMSADGRTVYFHSQASGQPLTFKVGIDGGQPVKLSDEYLRLYGISPDGRTLLGVGWEPQERRSVMATMPADGGPVRFIRQLPPGGVWAPSGNAITHLSVLAAKGTALLNSPMDGGKSETVVEVPDNIFVFAWSHDGKQLAISRGSVSTDVVMIAGK